MRQAVIVAPDRFEIQSVERPTLRSDDEIIVRTAACGICSGDLMPWYLAKKIGTVLGHEVVGWAEKVGSRVSHIHVGDLVFLHHHAPCGECDECRRGAPVHCMTWKSTALDPGGMAEFIRVPAEIVRRDAFAVNDLSVERAVFIEPLACSVKALRRAEGLQPARGACVAIVGCGVMGLLNLATARAYGAKQLVAIEPDPARQQAARDFGADKVYSPSEAAVLAGVTDIVIVGPGHPDVIRQSLAYVRPAGVAVLFTPTSVGTITPLDLGNLYFRDVSLVPSYSCGPEDTREAYRLLREGLVRPEVSITHRFPIESVQNAYDTARAAGPALKVLVTLAPENPRR